MYGFIFFYYFPSHYGTKEYDKALRTESKLQDPFLFVVFALEKYGQYSFFPLNLLSAFVTN